MAVRLLISEIHEQRYDEYGSFFSLFSMPSPCVFLTS